MTGFGGGPLHASITFNHPGALTSLGYHPGESQTKRRNALLAAVINFGKGSVVQKLNAVAVLTKNRNPQLSAIYNKDKAWVEKR